MTINVTGRGTNVQDHFRDLLDKKLDKFDRLFDKDARVDVTVTNEGGRETVEVTINSDGMVYRSESTTRDRFESLDIAVDTLFRQIIKNRSKLQDKVRKAAYDPKFEEAFEESFLELKEELAEDDHEDDEQDYKIVRSKQFQMKPMLPDEAILQMNMLGHDFFMFLNADIDDMSVVYRRNDGHYGLIEPTE